MKNHQLAIVCLIAVLSSAGNAEDFSAIGTEDASTEQLTAELSSQDLQDWIAYLKQTGQWPKEEVLEGAQTEDSPIELMRDSGEIEQNSGSRAMAICTDR